MFSLKNGNVMKSTVVVFTYQKKNAAKRKGFICSLICVCGEGLR